MLPLGYLGPRCEWHASGETTFTHNDQVTIMSLWSILPSPLIFGGNVQSLTTDATTGPWTVALLTNEEVLAVNQDALGTHAKRIVQQGTTEVWARDLSGGRKAVALFNRGTQDATVSVTFAQLGVSGTPAVRDLWNRADVTGNDDRALRQCSLRRRADVRALASVDGRRRRRRRLGRRGRERADRRGGAGGTGGASGTGGAGGRGRCRRRPERAARPGLGGSAGQGRLGRGRHNPAAAASRQVAVPATLGTGGANGTGGASATGGTSGTGGTTQAGGHSGTAGAPNESSGGGSGCSCEVGGDGAARPILLVVLFLWVRGRFAGSLRFRPRRRTDRP